jgi:glycosyltransferase involved in cell wall biosynthesis
VTPRVLQVVLSLNPGGTERLVVELTRRLHSEMPMAVCCLDEAGSWATELEGAGITVSALGRAPGFQPGLPRRVAAIAKAHDAAIIHAHHYSPFVYGALARVYRPGLRVVFTEHGRLSDAGPSPRRRAANTALRRLATRVFAVSNDVAAHLVAEGFRRGRVGVIYNGIDVGMAPAPADRACVRARLAAAPDELVIGTIARLDPVKDLRTLVEAVSHLVSERRVRLVIVGDGSEMPNLKQHVDGLRIAANVTFLGHRDDAREWLPGFDVFANSSTSEGVSLTILEAMAAGLPVVATAVGGTPEVLDEAIGRLVPARNPGALAAAIRVLAEDAVLRQNLGRTARRRVEARFALDRMVREYADVYRAVTSN